MKQRAAEIAGSNQQLFDLVKRKGSNKTVFEFDLSNANHPDYEKILLYAVSMLSKTMASAGRCVDIFPRQQLLEGTPVNSKEEEVKMMKVIRKLFVIYSTNAYMLEEHDRSTNYLTERNVGAGVFPFLSLINHSCIPNMAKITFDNRAVLVAIRPVKAGDQLFVSYGPLSR